MNKETMIDRILRSHAWDGAGYSYLRKVPKKEIQDLFEYIEYAEMGWEEERQ